MANDKFNVVEEKIFETADGYLADYANSEKCNTWVAKVIKTFLQNDSEAHIQELADDLLGIAEYTLADESVRIVDTSSNEVYLKELVHHSGVNALADNQMIRFTPQVNIIYGLNGTGKSSYFRILNEMIGGENTTPIRPNIYRDDTQNVSVDVKYCIDGVEKRISWDGSCRGLEELKSLRVFDSAYTRDLLRKRNSDELVVKPYGLNVFSDLILYIDQIIDKANEIILQKYENCPQIRVEGISEEIASLLIKEEYTEDDELKIRAIFASEAITESKIHEKEGEINNLKIGNPKDKIVILEAKKEHAEKTRQFLVATVAQANEYINSIKQSITSFIVQSKECEKYRKKLEVLHDIPGTDTKLWRDFVSKGIEYKEAHLMDVCPFCHQKYSDHAKDIVSAYVLFLDNKSQVDLETTERTLVGLVRNIERWNVTWELEDDKWSDELKSEAEHAIADISNIPQNLLKCIEAKSVEGIPIIDFNELTVKIEEYCKDIQEQIVALSEEVDGKTVALKQAETELSVMKTVFVVQSQHAEIEKAFEIKKWVSEKNKCISELPSQKQKISSLSKKAHNELLTEQLQSVFIENLNKLNVRNIDIELLGKNNKGIQQTELTIKSNKDVTTILSEGEQKATALALFLAEIFLSQNKSTIVFDDPVNSLDHRMMQALSDLLMNVENQIIVFTHNKMFLDCFECTEFGHICKGLDSACNKNKGKHIYLYETNSEGQNRKGVIIEKRIQNLQYYLDELKKMLDESPFTKYDEAGIKLRRGVETAIDEIVFNRQVPTKLSNKNSRINWEELKRISNDAVLIDGLKQIHGRASGGDLHNGSERENNPLDRDEIEQLYDNLKNLCHRV